jgi:maleate isomerase
LRARRLAGSTVAWRTVGTAMISKAKYRLGMLTPSSNTVLEPVVQAMLTGLPEVSAHFSRFRVTEISLSDQALGQFAEKPMLEAAELLAEAKVDAICWNGTSSGWLGLDQDRRLCERITQATGVPAVTSVLTLVEVFRRTAVEAFALVSPYTEDIQERIVETFRAEGFACIAERHASRRDNFSFAEVGEAELNAMVRAAAESNPQAITTFCTTSWCGPRVFWEALFAAMAYGQIRAGPLPQIGVWEASGNHRMPRHAPYGGRWRRSWLGGTWGIAPRLTAVLPPHGLSAISEATIGSCRI